MRQQIFALATTVLALSSSSLLAMMPVESAQAQTKGARFFCGRDTKGAPATMVELINKAKPPVVLIRWTSSFFSQSGYAPATRCAIVSKKFQDAYIKNPNFVFTTAVANSESVICAAESRGGACTTLLYTVKRGYQDPILTMLRLEQTRAGASGPLNESTGGGTTNEPSYVGVQDLIAKVLANRPQAADSKGATAKQSPITPAAITPGKAPSTTPRALW